MLPGLGIVAVTVGLVLLARGVPASRSPREAALLGASALGTYSLLALHWLPAAASPYGSVPGAVMAGMAVWGLHAGFGAVALALVAHAVVLPPRRPPPPLLPPPLLPLGMGAAWTLMEWAPGALPVVGIPLPSITFALVEAGTAPALLLSGAGQAGVAGAWALVGGAIAGLPWQVQGRGPRGGRKGRRQRWVLLQPAGAAVLLGGLALPAVVGGDEARETEGGGASVPVALVAWDRPSRVVGDPAAVAREVASLVELVPTLPPRDVPTVWPEAPAGTQNPDLDELWAETVLGASGEGLAGAIRRDPVDGRMRNVLLTGTEGGGLREVHGKRSLVPGVERTRVLRSGEGRGRGLAPGSHPGVFRWAGGRWVGAMICFEVLHPRGIYRQRRQGATLLVQATNDSMLRPHGPFPVWGDQARRQHRAAVRLRAVEGRLPVVRSAISGEVGGWDARGRRLPSRMLLPTPAGGDSPGLRILEVGVPPASARRPPSAWLGPLWGPLATGVLLAWALANGLNRPRRRPIFSGL